MDALLALPAAILAFFLRLGWVRTIALLVGIGFSGVLLISLFFLSSALYPLWKMQEASPWLYWLCAVSPFTHGVELVRFALYEQFNLLAMASLLVDIHGQGRHE